MQILYELGYPTRWYTKLLMALLALAFFAVLATMAIAGFLVYRIVKPQRTSSEINMASFPGRPEVLDFDVPGGIGKREGWFFPGFRGAPTIDRKSTRLNSSHLVISYAVFCLKKKKNKM